jgi:hypothetical protein
MNPLELLEGAMINIGAEILITWQVPESKKAIVAVHKKGTAEKAIWEYLKSGDPKESLTVYELYKDGGIFDVTERFIDDCTNGMTWTLSEIINRYKIKVSRQAITAWCNRNLISGEDYIPMDVNYRLYLKSGKKKIVKRYRVGEV